MRFIHENTVLFRRGLVKPRKAASSTFGCMRTSRLFLRGFIDNMQTSWVKLGVDLAALTLKRRMQRFLRHPDGGEHHRTGGGTAGEFVAGRPDRRERRARSGALPVERHTLTQALRQKGSQWRAADHSTPLKPSITTLAGGVGAAKFLRGLVRRVDPRRVTVIVNTGDDEEFFGLHVSPDIDTVIYTLAGVINHEHGWGLEGESFNALDALGRFYGKPWFNLGDRDLATHLYRTERLRAGARLSEVTAEIAESFGWGREYCRCPTTACALSSN